MTGRAALLPRVVAALQHARVPGAGRLTARVLTHLGRDPRRHDLTATCRQCDAGRVRVVRLGRRHARYWCPTCGAVVTVHDLTVLRAIRTPTAPVRHEDPLREVMPAVMLQSYAGRPPALDALRRAYDRWDEAHPTGLPRFGAVVRALDDHGFDSVAAYRALGDGPDPRRWERVEHARRWVDLTGGGWLGRDADATVDPAVPVAVLASLRAGERPDDGAGRAVRAAVFGTTRGPMLRTLVERYGLDQLSAAITSYVDSGARPLRDEAVARLRAPIRAEAPDGG